MNVFKTQDGTTLQFQLIGEGQPLLLMHGFTEKGTVWANIASQLKDQFQILIPFLPTTNANDLNIEFQQHPTIDQIAVYINELAISIFQNEAFHFVGHSMGGYIGLALAHAHPEKIISFTFFHSTAYADTEEKKMIRQRSIEFIEQHGATLYLKQSIAGLFSNSFRENHPDLLQSLINEQLDQSPKVLTIYLKAMKGRQDYTSILRSLPIPFLFIAGEEDLAVPLSHAVEQQKIPKDSTIAILRRSAHMAMIEEPELSLKYLKDFLIRLKD